jgi:hypothetical protein
VKRRHGVINVLLRKAENRDMKYLVTNSGAIRSRG